MVDKRTRVGQELPMLGSRMRCEKCGSDDLKLHYRPGDACGAPDCTISFHHEQEHILLVCQTCHYDWPEHVLDGTEVEYFRNKEENAPKPGAWFVYGHDTMPYPIGITDNREDALHLALLNHGHVIFWPFGEVWDDIKDNQNG